MEMDRVDIDRLLAEIPNLNFRRIKDGNIPNGIWFDLEVKPLPISFEELEMVIFDVNKDNMFHLMENGTLTHYKHCNEENHILNINLKRALKKFKNQTYKIAIWEGNINDNFLDGQPVVISLEPEISFNIYPDHPHLNAAGILNNSYIPNSICYTDNPKALGNDPYERILEAIQQALIWLFKHQVWLASRKIGKGIWIGPQVSFDEKDQFKILRNPYGKCYCGSNKQYCKCHLNNDFKNECLREPRINFYKNDDGHINLEKYNNLCMKYQLIPQVEGLKQLKKSLL